MVHTKLLKKLLEVQIMWLCELWTASCVASLFAMWIVQGVECKLMTSASCAKWEVWAHWGCKLTTVASSPKLIC